MVYLKNELDDLVNGFLDKSLDKTKWTHEAHIITAIWHLMNYPEYDALCRIKSGIIAYNLAVGTENSGQQGYHETMTLFWWEWIRQYLLSKHKLSFEEICNHFLNNGLGDRSIPFLFYSKEYLFSAQARSKYMPPDIMEIKLIQPKSSSQS